MLTENLMWLFWGLLILTIIGVVVFIVRNNMAKTDRDPKPQDRLNESGVAPIVKTKNQ